MFSVPLRNFPDVDGIFFSFFFLKTWFEWQRFLTLKEGYKLFTHTEVTKKKREKKREKLDREVEDNERGTKKFFER